MNIDTKEIIANTKKVVVFLIANIYGSACEHPFVLGLVFFLLLLYRFLPFVFGFLVSSSPIIICTALLLGTLLSFGEPNIPEIEEETSHDHSLPCMHVVVNDLIVEKEESYPIESHVENRKRVVETTIKEADVTEQVDHVRKSERVVLLSAIDDEEEREPEAAIVTELSFVVNKRPKNTENIAATKEETNDRKHLKKEELHEAEFLEDATESAELVHLATSSQNYSEDLKVEISEPALDSHFDSSFDTSWKLINSHDASDSGSDRAESSSPDASMSVIMPMLYELHPLLDTEDPQPDNAPVDDLHSMSGESAEEGESDDGSVEELAENQEEDGEEEETKEEKEDGAALAVKWTEDDEKNLRVLGTSELERNQRLENLIAKRIARKNLRIEAEKNLIDLDGNETVSIMDELSCLQLQIPPISTGRRNPFDFPYDSEESTGLPPIPGSAPSVLLPRRNPFDLPHGLAEESSSLTGLSQSHQGFLTAPQREMLFRRRESFALGASFGGEFRQEKHDIKLRQYFVTERTNLEETSYAHFQRQLTEKSDSKVSYIPESETVSSIVDQDYNCNLSEQQLHQESEFELVSSSTNDARPVERQTSSLDEVDSVDSLSRQKGVNISSSHDVYVNSFEDCGASIRGAPNDFRKLTKQNSHDQDLCSPISDAAESDVIEGKYTRSSSSAPSEISGRNFSTKAEEGSIDLQRPSGDCSEHSSVSVQSVSGEIEVVNDSHVVEPVYDSSPLAAEKSICNIASFEEELLPGDQESSTSTSSLSSETLVETSEMGAPPLPGKRNIFSEIEDFLSGSGSMGEVSASDNGQLWVAPPNLSSVEENESRSREVGEIREQDIIQIEFSEANDAYGQQTASMLSESAIEQIMCYSSSTPTSTDSSEDGTMDIGENHQLTEHEKMVLEAFHSDVLASSDDFSSEVSTNVQSSLESSTVQASFDTSLLEQQVEALPPIPKDFSEYHIHEEEYDNAPTSVTNNESIGSPKIEVPDVEHGSSVLHKKPEEIDSNDNMNRTECVLENGVDIPDSSSVGVELPSQVERMEFLILSERAKIHETLSNSWSTDSKNETLDKQENGLPEHANGSDASDVVHAVNAEEIKRIDDDEALLLELDAIGDFRVEELSVADNRTKSLYPHDIFEKEINEVTGYMKSETSGSVVLLTETHPDLVEICRDLQEVEARSLEDIHMALKQVSEGTTGNPPKPSESDYILDPQGAEARLSEDIHMQASGGTFEGSSEDIESDVLQAQDIEAGPLEVSNVVSEHLLECTDDHPPKLIDSKNDSSEFKATAIHLEERMET